MKPTYPRPEIDITNTNLVSLPPAGQTAQLEFLGATGLEFRILPYTVREKVLMYIQMSFGKSHLFLPAPPAGYVPKWSLREEDGRTLVENRRITARAAGRLLDKVEVQVNGTKTHILTIHCPGSELLRVLKIFKPYYNPSLNLSIAHGGNPSREPFETIYPHP